jgi:hypothetical protein
MRSGSIDRSTLLRRTGGGLAIAGAVVLAAVPLAAPAPAPNDAPPSEFSAVRAEIHLQAIASEPHPMGSPANAGVGDYLIGVLAASGLDIATQSLEVPDYFGSGDTAEIRNIAARIPGTASTGTIVLMAHYDSDPGTPGANDNAAAVSALLETARALTTGERPLNDVIILASDGEEPAPRYGAKAYFDSHPWAADSAVVVNFEALGRSGPSVLVEVTSPDRWLVNAYRDAVSHPAAFSFLPAVLGRVGELGSDFDVVRERGIAGLHFAYSRGSPIYHTMLDVPERVDRRSLQHHGEHALGLARMLSDIDFRAAVTGGNAVAFTIGRRLVLYSTGWAAVSAGLPLLVLAAAAAMRRRTGRWSHRSVLSSALRSIVGCLVGGALGTLAWLGLTSLRPTPAVMESYAYLAALTAIAALACRAAHRVGDPGGNRWDRLIGVTAVWAGLALAVGLAAPRIGYLFVWPGLAAAAAAAIRTGTRPTRLLHHIGFAALVATPASVLLLPAVDVFFQIAQPRPGNPDSQLTAMILVPLLLGALAIELVRHTIAAASSDAAEPAAG